MQSRYVLVVAIIVGMIAAAYIILVGKPDQKDPAVLNASQTPVATPAPGNASQPEAMQPMPDTKTSDADPARQKLQSRLDAIAQAYDEGNIKAIELAIWKNHAVVRPNGEHLDRAGVLRNWTQEWTQLHNRDLTLSVVSFERSEDYVNASWSVDLAADIQDEFGETHKFKLHGLQEARYLISGDEEQLDGPITYTLVDQTMNGEPWPTQ